MRSLVIALLWMCAVLAAAIGLVVPVWQTSPGPRRRSRRSMRPNGHPAAPERTFRRNDAIAYVAATEELR